MTTPTLEARIRAQLNADQLIQELLDAGFSYERIAVEIGENLAGANPSVQSLRRWKLQQNTPSRMNGASLALVHEKLLGGPE